MLQRNQKMTYSTEWLIVCVVCGLMASAQATDGQPSPRQLDPISGGDVLRRNADDDELSPNAPDFRASDVLRTLTMARILDSIGGGDLLRALRTNAEIARFADGGLNDEEFLERLNDFRGSDALKAMELLSDGAISRALEGMDGTQLLYELDKARRDSRFKNKRNLDTLSGMAFGEMKRRMNSLSKLAKRNFDEIDNVGFNGWQKRLAFAPDAGRRWNTGRQRIFTLARRGFGGRSGTSSLAKKNFDEIDRTGFEGFSKRESKTSA